MIQHWWDIPVIAIGLSVGNYLGLRASLWLKRKLGWIE